MGTSAKDVKNRIKSVESTMHITKAMELVASSKLKRAKERMEKCQAYFSIIQNALNDIASGDSSTSSVFTTKKEVKKKCFIVIAGDRGLAGGYNNNVFKLVVSNMDVESCVVPIGKRSVEFFERRNYEILSKDFSVIDSLGRKESTKLGKMLTKEFLKGSFDELNIVYTHFNNMLSQTAKMIKILPLTKGESTKEKPAGFVLYEPGAEAVYSAIIPEYVSGIIYGAICDSYACELAARRIAMDSASKNAEKMIDDLSLKYNRARQNAITQEITEIVGGAEG